VLEDELKAALIEAAKWSGWLVHHDRPCRRQDGTWYTAIEGDAGYPDLHLINVRNRRQIMAELKGDRGKLSPDQTLWIEAARAAGIETYVWWPADEDAALAIITAQTRPEEVGSDPDA